MNEVNLKNYEFKSYLLDNVKLFDEVLAECGEPPLLENSNFSAFLDFPITSGYLVLEAVTKRESTLPITIWFEGDSLRIDIEGMNETFDWSKKQIEETREKIVELIRNLFTGFILIETRKSSRFIQIFDADGFFALALSYNNLFHMLTGLYLFRYENYHRLYLPIFSKRK